MLSKTGCFIQHIEDETKWLPFCRRRFKLIFPYKDFCILIQISWSLFPNYPINNTLALVHMMAWLLTGNPDSKVHGANMGPIWGRQDVGPMNLAIRDYLNQWVTVWAVALGNLTSITVVSDERGILILILIIRSPVTEVVTQKKSVEKTPTHDVIARQLMENPYLVWQSTIKSNSTRNIHIYASTFPCTIDVRYIRWCTTM